MKLDMNNFVKVGKGRLLSKTDPNFYKKYFEYKPNDADMLYQYAKILKKQGNQKEWFTYLQRAAKNGHPIAQYELQNFKPEKMVQTVQKERGILDKVLLALTISLLLMILLLLLFPFDRYFSVKDKYVTQGTEYQTQLVRYFDRKGINDGTGEVTSAEQLPILVAENAVERFKEATGDYPQSAEDMTKSYPSNWISFMPNGVSYQKESGDYTLQTNQAVAPLHKGLMELWFYPESNQLAVMNGTETLAVYPVASGKDPLPFSESKVSARVTDPNGGKGALGTRGFQLQDNYAIHGTNDPSSIGKKVSKGCIRMNNSDIEKLYPYISDGTPFKVKSGTPEQPTFESGLPQLGDLNAEGSPSETTSEQLKWKN